MTTHPWRAGWRTAPRRRCCRPARAPCCATSKASGRLTTWQLRQARLLALLLLTRLRHSRLAPHLRQLRTRMRFSRLCRRRRARRTRCCSHLRRCCSRLACRMLTLRMPPRPHRRRAHRWWCACARARLRTATSPSAASCRRRSVQRSPRRCLNHLRRCCTRISRLRLRLLRWPPHRAVLACRATRRRGSRQTLALLQHARAAAAAAAAAALCASWTTAGVAARRLVCASRLHARLSRRRRCKRCRCPHFWQISFRQQRR